MLSQGNSLAVGDGKGSTMQRVKTELVFTGENLLIPTTAVSLIGLLKTLTPDSGQFAPFFNTATNKFFPQNFGSPCLFKLNMEGSFPGGTGNRGIQLTFPGSTGNTEVVSRNAATVTDVMSIRTFFSIDKDGNLATNGADIQIQANGAEYTANIIVLIADQFIWI